MGVLDMMRGRNDTRNAQAIAQSKVDQPHVNDSKIPADLSESDSADNLSLEAQNEKEIQQHPDSITVGAQPGVQKAEAAALVWSKPALYSAYAW